MSPMEPGPASESIRRSIQDEYRFCIYRLEAMSLQNAVQPKLMNSVTTRMRTLRETFPLYLAELGNRKEIDAIRI